MDGQEGQNQVWAWALNNLVRKMDLDGHELAVVEGCSGYRGCRHV